MIKNCTTDITRNWMLYVDYGSRTKVPNKIDSAENNEKKGELILFENKVFRF